MEALRAVVEGSGGKLVIRDTKAILVRLGFSVADISRAALALGLRLEPSHWKVPGVMPDGEDRYWVKMEPGRSMPRPRTGGKRVAAAPG